MDVSCSSENLEEDSSGGNTWPGRQVESRLEKFFLSTQNVWKESLIFEDKDTGERGIKDFVTTILSI